MHDASSLIKRRVDVDAARDFMKIAGTRKEPSFRPGHIYVSMLAGGKRDRS